jgi:hypothetical protein
MPVIFAAVTYRGRVFTIRYAFVLGNRREAGLVGWGLSGSSSVVPVAPLASSQRTTTNIGKGNTPLKHFVYRSDFNNDSILE